MSEIASAYISLLPSFKGGAAAIDQQVSGPAAVSGKRSGVVFGKALASGIAVAGVAVIAAVKGLYEAGSVIDESQDTIRTSTGKTGKALDALNKSVQNVAKKAPVAFESIAPVIADLNRRLGLTGKPLEKLSQQFLDLGHITGEEVDIDSVTGALNLFGVKGDQVSKVMDQLFRVSQSTGVSFNELVSSLQRNGANLTQFGFSVSESASLIGTLDKAGIDSNKTLATLSKAMVTFAKDGQKPRAALLGTIDQVQKLVKAGDQAGAVNLASKVFGTRGASQFIAAIRSGRLNVDQLTAATKGNNDTIIGATKDTADFAEQWQLFKNNVLVALIPLATRVFNAVGSVGASLNTSLIPTFRTLFTSIQSGDGSVGKFAATLRTLGSYIQTTVVPVIKSALIESLNAGRSAFNQIRKAVEDNKPEMQQVASAAKQIATVLITRVIPASIKAAATLVKILGIAIGGTVRAIGVLVGAFNRAKSGIVAAGAVIAGAVKFFKSLQTGATNAMKGLLTYVSKIPSKIKSYFAALPGQLKAIGSQIVEGLVRGISSAAGRVDAAVRSLVSRIPKKIRSLMGIASPSKVTTVIGGQIGDGLAKGIDNSRKKVIGRAKSLMDSLKDKLSGLADDFQGLVDPIASNFTQGLFDFDNASAFVANLTSTKGTLTNLLDAFTTLKGFGLSPGFLYQLFQNGGAGLILDLAGNKDLAVQAGSTFGQITDFSNTLGNRVALNTDKGADIQHQTDVLGAKLDKVIDKLGNLGVDVGDAVNKPAKNARKRGKRKG